MQAAEEQYKLQFTKMQDKLREDLGRYEVLKSDANEKLFTANGRLEEVKKTGEAQILKLRAMLKKEEMRIKSLEKDPDSEMTLPFKSPCNCPYTAPKSTNKKIFGEGGALFR